MVRKPEKANGHNNNAKFPSLPSIHITQERERERERYANIVM